MPNGRGPWFVTVTVTVTVTESGPDEGRAVGVW
jgi:hypothetical protein